MTVTKRPYRPDLPAFLLEDLEADAKSEGLGRLPQGGGHSEPRGFQ